MRKLPFPVENREKTGKAGTGLFYRDQLLWVVNQVAEMLLSSNTAELEEPLYKAMDVMARGAGADRMYIWQNKIINGKLYYEQQYEWLREDLKTNTLRSERGLSYIECIPTW